MMHTVTVSLSESAYQRLQRAAEISGKPIDEIAAQSIQENLPPLLDVVPAQYRDELHQMEALDDKALWAIAEGVFDSRDERRFRRLLEKNGRGQLTAAEREEMARLRQAADRLMLKKAYAYLLLKWRGYRIPNLS